MALQEALKFLVADDETLCFSQSVFAAVLAIDQEALEDLQAEGGVGFARSFASFLTLNLISPLTQASSPRKEDAP